MKKFKFSLSTVLSYKQQVLDALQAEHAAVIAEVHAQEKKIQQLQDEYNAFAEEYRRRCQEGMDIREAVGHQAKLRARERELEQENLLLQQVRKKEEAKRAEVVEAKKETSSLEKLRDKKRTEYNAAMAKDEEKFIDEFISSQRAGMSR